MTSRWKRIQPHVVPKNVTELFVRYSFGSSEYLVQLTDLTHLWSESIERRELIRRAWDAGSSIDPSEGPSQMQLLMNNIKASLDSQAGSSLTIKTEGDNLERLRLDTFTPLPGGLKPLTWPIHLHSCPQASLTTNLIYPCLSTLAVLNDQVQSLLQILKEKDNTITKLLEKLQSDPIGLADALSGSGKSRPSMAMALSNHAMKAFKGLAPFDEAQWRSQNHNVSGNHSLGSISVALELVGSGLPSSRAEHEQLMNSIVPLHHILPANNIDKDEHVFSKASSPQARLIDCKSPIMPKTDYDISGTEGSTTEDTEDEADKPRQPSSLRVDGLRPGGGERVIERSHDNHTAKESSRSSSRSSSTLGDAANVLVADEPDVTKDLTIRSQPSTNPTVDAKEDSGIASHRPSKPEKSKLGKIGGRKEADKVAATALNNLARASAAPDASTPVAKTRSNVAPDAVQGDQINSLKDDPKDRANRKREQLRQELQAGNNAPRKKRKF